MVDLLILDHIRLYINLIDSNHVSVLERLFAAPPSPQHWSKTLYIGIFSKVNYFIPRFKYL